MKRYLQLIFAFLVVVISFNSVNARELLATCSYTSDIIDFTIKIYDSKDYLEFSPAADFNIAKKSGGSMSYFGYNNLDKNNYFSEIYSNNKLSPKCPSVSICEIGENVYVGDNGEICGNGGTSILVSGTMKKESSNVEQKTDKSKTYCTRYFTTKTDPVQKKIVFGLDSDGNKIFKIYNNNNTNQGGEANYDGLVSIGNRVYSINERVVEYFWNEDTCETTPLYQKFYNGSTEHVVITDKESDGYLNASVDNGWDGFEKDNNASNSTSKDGNDNDDNDKSNSDVVNDNVSVESICSKPYYRKPMKFIGTLVGFIKILVPIIIIAFGVMDLYKAITGSKDEALPKAIKMICIRVLAGVFIFLLPGIVQFVLGLVNEWSGYKNNWCCCTECILTNNCDVNSCSSNSCRDGGF